MQKITLAGLLAAGIISFAPLAQAASQNNGGFNGPNTMTIMTVEQAQGLTDETAVVLQGNIQKASVTICTCLATVPEQSTLKSTKAIGTASTSIPMTSSSFRVKSTATAMS